METVMYGFPITFLESWASIGGQKSIKEDNHWLYIGQKTILSFTVRKFCQLMCKNSLESWGVTQI
jgi:hypothetical protein